jgi:hypothetical protein
MPIAPFSMTPADPPSKVAMLQSTSSRSHMRVALGEQCC